MRKQRLESAGSILPQPSPCVIQCKVSREPGVVGSATVGADIASPAGYALRTGKAVISNHLDNEDRFRTPELLVEHGASHSLFRES
jgi:hypothetical protein